MPASAKKRRVFICTMNGRPRAAVVGPVKFLQWAKENSHLRWDVYVLDEGVGSEARFLGQVREVALREADGI